MIFSRYQVIYSFVIFKILLTMLNKLLTIVVKPNNTPHSDIEKKIEKKKSNLYD